MTTPANEPIVATPPAQDEWATTVIEIEADQRRLATLTDPADVAREMGQTVLSYVKDIAKRLVEVRDYAHQRLEYLSNGLSQLSEGLGEVAGGLQEMQEMIDDDSHLTAEDATDFMKYVRGMQIVAEQFLERASGLDADGRQKIEELVALGKKLEPRIEEIGPDDEDDLEDEATA